MPCSGTDFYGQNYLSDQNPYHLAGPPRWWLQKLWEFDRDLVILPGITECVYRVTRRSPRAKALRPLSQESETQRMWRHGVLPVTSLVPWTAWNDDFFQWLRDHDTWALKGRDRAGDAAADRLDDLDREKTSRIERTALNELDAVNASSYEAMQRRVGTRVTLSQPATPVS